MTPQDAALAAHAVGLSVVPPREDGSKAPLGEWERYQQERPTEAQVRSWYAKGRTGVGVVCGQVSGGLEMFEFEGRAVVEGVHERFRELCEAAGLGDVLDRIAKGYCELTPTGGYHLLYRVPSPSGSTKLARRAARPDELTDDERQVLARKPDKVFWRPLIEVKGEGGYTIVAPTNGRVHPCGGQWELVTGDLATIATIGDDERDELHRLARTLHEEPVERVRQRTAGRPRPAASEARPGDAYNTEGDPQQRMLGLLEGHGWTHVYGRGEVAYLRRPGKRQGISATLGYAAPGLLYVYSCSTEFDEETWYTPFAAYTLLEHGGDFSAAARTLRAQGYGDASTPEPSAPTRTDAPVSPAAEDAETGPFVDWAAFWARDRREAEWTFPDVLAHGRGHAVYASHKAGKSLLLLHIAARLATGPQPMVVAYFDYEMGEDDLYERLEEMGYGPATDLSRLRYALLPTLPPLDTRDGAEALTGLLDGVQGDWPDHHLVVVFDTTARAVAGEENSADTFRSFYAHTGIELKRRGVTWARLDHAGKDPGRGQRGSSSKGDDVDVVWKLTRTENGVQLRRDVARMSWVPEKVTFAMAEDPLRFVAIEGDWPAGTRETAAALDALGVPLDVTTRGGSEALREAGEGRRRAVIVAALKWRRERAQEGPEPPPEPLIHNQAGTTSGTTSGNGATTGRNHPRNRQEPLPRETREPPVPPYGVRVPEPGPDSALDEAVREASEQLGATPTDDDQAGG